MLPYEKRPTINTTIVTDGMPAPQPACIYGCDTFSQASSIYDLTRCTYAGVLSVSRNPMEAFKLLEFSSPRRALNTSIVNTRIQKSKPLNHRHGRFAAGQNKDVCHHSSPLHPPPPQYVYIYLETRHFPSQKAVGFVSRQRQKLYLKIGNQSHAASPRESKHGPLCRHHHLLQRACLPQRGEAQRVSTREGKAYMLISSYY